MAQTKINLKFNEDKRFRILHLTDLHFGESDKRDSDNQINIKSILESTKPDVVIVTGDLVSGYSWDG